MSLRKAFRLFWVGGLVLFAAVLALHLPLTLTAVPNGILDHQSAGTAAEVNRIQAAWMAAGVIGTARFAMIGDLIFIGVYGTGCVLGGWYYMRTGHGFVRLLGMAALIAGFMFLITDYGETLAQLVQLLRGRGGSNLAAFAATMQPIKVVAWITTVLSITFAFLLRRALGRARA